MVSFVLKIYTHKFVISVHDIDKGACVAQHYLSTLNISTISSLYDQIAITLPYLYGRTGTQQGRRESVAIIATLVVFRG